MRTLSLTFVTVALWLVPFALNAQETENPYRAAKVGDYVVHKGIILIMGKEIESIMKSTVLAKSETELTVQLESTLAGKKQQAAPYKVDLTKPFDPTASLMQGKRNFKLEITDRGKEKIKVGENTYACRWIAGKIIDEFAGKKLESDWKIWISESVPLAGTVKTEIRNQFSTARIELSSFGNQK